MTRTNNLKSVFMKLIMLLLPVIIFGFANAVNVNPILSGYVGACTQLNASHLSCQDGHSTTVGFLVSAPYDPMLGNFTVSQNDLNNFSQPFDMYGNQCSVESSSTNTCFVTMNPISILSGNGTEVRGIHLRLTSSEYPQIFYYQTINFTIKHYTNNSEQTALLNYEYAYKNYSIMYSKYNYFCSIYGLCNTTLSTELSTAGHYINNATKSLNDAQTSNAMYYTSLAAYSIRNTAPVFNLFINTSNNIVNKIIYAQQMAYAMKSYYYENLDILNTCTMPSGDTYADYLNKTVSLATLNQSPLASEASTSYLDSLNSSLKTETITINNCKRMEHTVISLQNVTSQKENNKTAKPSFIDILVVLVAALSALYVVLKINGIREIKKIREGQGNEFE